MIPYWLAERSYHALEVKIVLAAGGHEGDALDQPARVDGQLLC
jgi:hypothetical protein